MKSLLIFMLEAWYTDVRKHVPAKIAKRVNSGIRSFERNNSDVKDAVKKAKNSAVATHGRRTRNAAKLNKAKQIAAARHVEVVPCGQKTKPF